MEAAGFVDIRVEKKEESREMISNWLPGSNAGEFVVSAKIFANKPQDGRVPTAAARAEATLAKRKADDATEAKEAETKEAETKEAEKSKSPPPPATAKADGGC